MLRIATRACIVILAVVGLWLALIAWTRLAGPKQESLIPVATIRHEYASPRTHQQAVRAIEALLTENGFFLSGGAATPRTIDGWELVDLTFMHREHGTEILISTLRKANVVDVIIYDKLHRGAWPEIKDKVEAAMQRLP